VISWDGAEKNSDQASVFAAAMRNTLVRLSTSGKNVVLFIDWPELNFNPRSCLPRPVALFSHVRPLCGVPRSAVDERNRAYREVIFEMKTEFSGLRVFDPFPILAMRQRVMPSAMDGCFMRTTTISQPRDRRISAKSSSQNNHSLAPRTMPLRQSPIRPRRTVIDAFGIW
jgi:hypothetical protein